MLYEKDLQKKLWAKTANIVVFLLNRLPIEVLNKKLHLKLSFGTNQIYKI